MGWASTGSTGPIRTVTRTASRQSRSVADAVAATKTCRMSGSSRLAATHPALFQATGERVLPAGHDLLRRCPRRLAQEFRSASLTDRDLDCRAGVPAPRGCGGPSPRSAREALGFAGTVNVLIPNDDPPFDRRQKMAGAKWSARKSEAASYARVSFSVRVTAICPSATEIEGKRKQASGRGAQRPGPRTCAASTAAMGEGRSSRGGASVPMWRSAR